MKLLITFIICCGFKFSLFANTKMCVMPMVPDAAGYSGNSAGNTADTAVTWWATKDGVRIIEGTHACNQWSSAHSGIIPTPCSDATCSFCFCRRTRLNGQPNLGPWTVNTVWNPNAAGSANCRAQCAWGCSHFILSNADWRSAMLAPLLP